ncbi:MAG: hypothetical protein ABSG68_02040 [Thermoguttaceae bacterium]|jgi:hypothetical protein
MPSGFDPHREWLGISAHEQPANHYRLLGLSLFENDQETIRSAATQQMSHLGSFRAGWRVPIVEQVLAELAAARDCLLSPPEKAAYDAELRKQLPLRPLRNTPSVTPPSVTPPSIGERLRTPPRNTPPSVTPPPIRPGPWSAAPPPPLRNAVEAAANEVAGPLDGEASVSISGAGAAAPLPPPLPQRFDASPVTMPEEAAQQSSASDVFGDPPPAPPPAEDALDAGLMEVVEAAVHQSSISRVAPKVAADVPPPTGYSLGYRITVCCLGVALLALSAGIPTAILMRRAPPPDENGLAKKTAKSTAGDATAAAVAQKPEEQTQVTFDWPAQQRAAARLEIDEAAQQIPAAGADAEHFSVSVKPGEHTIHASGDHIRELRRKINVLAGQAFSISVPANTAPAEPPKELAANGQPAPNVADNAQQKGEPSSAPSAATAPATSGGSRSAAGKNPVPLAAEKQAAGEQIEAQYGLSKAVTAAQKVTLARELYGAAKKPDLTPAMQFMLLRKGAELAADGGDASLTLPMIDAIVAEFDISPFKVKARFLGPLAKTTTDKAILGLLPQFCQDAAKEASAEDDYDSAVTLLDTAYRLALRSSDKKLRKAALDRKNETKAVLDQWKDYQSAAKLLEAHADEPQANLTVGRWHCLRKGDWKKGLPYLARGADERFRTLAKAELSEPPGEAGAQVKLGDNWWELSQQHVDKAAVMLRQHAASWYEQARPRITSGEVSGRIQQRTEEAARLAALDANPEKVPVKEDTRDPREPVGCLPVGQDVDLLALVRIPRHVVQGSWFRVADGISTLPADSTRLMFPIVVRGDYDLKLEFTRTAGDDCVTVNLPVGQQDCCLLLSGWHGEASGLEAIDGKGANENVSTRRGGDGLANERRHTLLARVRPSQDPATIDVVLDGEPYIHWDRTQGALSTSRVWSLPQPNLLGLGGCQVGLTVHAVRLSVVAGKVYPLSPDNALVEPYGRTCLSGGAVGWLFSEVGPAGQRLLGLQIAQEKVVRGIQPFYGTTTFDAVAGPWHGREAGTKQKEIAKDGYAVGGLRLRVQNQVEGLRVIFMRVKKEGTLDPSDFYESRWTGGSVGPEVRTASDGPAVLGLHSSAGDSIDALGLLLDRGPAAARPAMRLVDQLPLASGGGNGLFLVNTALRDVWPLIPPDAEPCTEYLFAHAPSKLVYAVPSGARSFCAVGYCVASRSVAFELRSEGRPFYRSEQVGIARVRVDLPPRTRMLELVVDDLGDKARDYSFWLFPRFYAQDVSQFNGFASSARQWPLTNLRPLSATVGHSVPMVNRVEGAVPPLKMSQPEWCDDFIHAQAGQHLVFAVPDGAKQFTAFAYCVNAGEAAAAFCVSMDGKLRQRTAKEGIVRIELPIPRRTKELELFTEVPGDARNIAAFWCYPRISR